MGLDADISSFRSRLFVASNSTILLEFTPLSYSRFGTSFPLLLRLLLWRLKRCRVIIYFHELPFSNGRSLRSFLAVVMQRFYCGFLMFISSYSILNQFDLSRSLQFFSGRRRLFFMPTFSNIGECESVDLPGIRPLQVVVFGSPGKRRHAHTLVASLGGYRRMFGPQVRVVDIGEYLDLPIELLPEVHPLGPLPSHEVQVYLLSSRFGFFYSESNQFSKSGVFAAYAAHGVVPIISNQVSFTSPYFLTPEEVLTQSPRFIVLDSVWSSCREWYRKYSVQKCASLLYMLNNGP
ncbi:hypothetical protein OAZ06_00210 [Synechococcus sp. AH-736-G20]|nr:hypothetical protein [Synechococcus sp. AH-736-G20]